jgi:hypothetical protein
MIVKCIDDTKQPIGGQVVKGREYQVQKQFINNFDQKVYLIVGITNEGRTAMGLPWKGYNANRFTDIDTQGSEQEHDEVSELLQAIHRVGELLETV